MQCLAPFDIMSQQLTLEISDEAYAELQEKANAVGLQVAEWIITLLNQQGGSKDLDTGIAATAVSETALLSEQSLSVDWNRPEEDAAWAHLRSDQ